MFENLLISSQIMSQARNCREPDCPELIDIIVIDSVAALVPRSEIEGEMGDSKVGLQARLMSQALRNRRLPLTYRLLLHIYQSAKRENCVLFGNPETTTGNTLKFYASIRLDIRRSGSPPKIANEILIGNSVKVKVVKMNWHRRSRLQHLISCTDRAYRKPVN